MRIMVPSRGYLTSPRCFPPFLPSSHPRDPLVPPHYQRRSLRKIWKPHSSLNRHPTAPASTPGTHRSLRASDPGKARHRSVGSSSAKRLEASARPPASNVGFPSTRPLPPGRPTRLGAGSPDLPRSDRYDHLVVMRAQVQVSKYSIPQMVLSDFFLALQCAAC